MPNLPETYFDFVMDYAPYVYVIPESGPDPTWGRAAFAAGFAVDFLFEAYFDRQFDSRSAEIENKIVELADWILTQQCNDPEKLACGGFKSTETSTQYYAVDACRTIPALLKAYELTSNTAYLDAAVLAGDTFLFNMQQKPSELGVHERYFGGFARAVSIEDAWLPEMDLEPLYGLVALGMLCESDPDNRARYEAVMADAVNFYRVGLESCFDHFSPKPTGDNSWHRVDAADAVTYDDTLAYALLGLYDYEDWSDSVQRAYAFLNGVGACRAYPAYNPAVCWAGYIDAVAKAPTCDYYDAVTAGILSELRRDHDKTAYEFSAQTIKTHPDQFMFWGVKHADFGFVENVQAMATVCWLGELLLSYEAPLTRFTQVLNSKGEPVTLYPVASVGEQVQYGEGVNIKAIFLPAKAEETLLEPGYVATDYVTLHVFAPVRLRDKLRCRGLDYEATEVQEFGFKGETTFHKVTCRRLLP
ncbi:MAG: hypothetical protein NWF00_01535 [Candidatus Bathyarchaeota archaeon]|nr:hypothetical protein [Candidatus Bathyarchaeota archaeon]